MKIGIFDSGLGGLSILKEILKILPEYDYIYIGDNARVPYGTRSPELIYSFTKNAIEFLFKKNCKLVILACNTASSTALRKIQQEYLPKYHSGRRVLGVIKPTIEKINQLQLKRVGVIGTYATINSKAFVKELMKDQQNIKVYQQACPLLVPMIEEGEIEWRGLTLILEKYFAPLKKKQINSMILGCTHYGLIAGKIQKTIGRKVTIINQGHETALRLKDYLQKHKDIEKSLTKKRKREFFVTDLNERYKKLAQMFYGEKIELKLRPIS